MKTSLYFSLLSWYSLVWSTWRIPATCRMCLCRGLMDWRADLVWNVFFNLWSLSLLSISVTIGVPLSSDCKFLLAALLLVQYWQMFLWKLLFLPQAMWLIILDYCSCSFNFLSIWLITTCGFFSTIFAYPAARSGLKYSLSKCPYVIIRFKNVHLLTYAPSCQIYQMLLFSADFKFVPVFYTLLDLFFSQVLERWAFNSSCCQKHLKEVVFYWCFVKSRNRFFFLLFWHFHYLFIVKFPRTLKLNNVTCFFSFSPGATMQTTNAFTIESLPLCVSISAVSKATTLFCKKWLL